MFPVQWVAKIVASRAAAFSFFFFTFFLGGGIGKYCPFLGKKKKSLVTQPLNQELNYLYGQPIVQMEENIGKYRASPTNIGQYREYRATGIPAIISKFQIDPASSPPNRSYSLVQGVAGGRNALVSDRQTN